MHIDPVEHAARHTAAIHAAAELAEQSHTELFAQIAAAIEQGKTDAAIDAPAWPGQYTLLYLLTECIESAEEPAQAFFSVVIGHAVVQASSCEPIAFALRESLALAVNDGETKHLVSCAIQCCPHLLASTDAQVRLETMAAIAALARSHADRHCEAAAEAGL